MKRKSISNIVGVPKFSFPLPRNGELWPGITNPFLLSLFYCHPVVSLCHCSAEARVAELPVLSSWCPGRGSLGGKKGAQLKGLLKSPAAGQSLGMNHQS